MAGKKKQQTKTVESVSPLEEIYTLQSCLSKCEEDLLDACVKAKKQIEKELVQAQAKLTKVRAKLKVAREKVKTLKAELKEKASKSLQTRAQKAGETLELLKEEFSALQQLVLQAKVQKVELKMQAQKFVARQKAVQRFDKVWEKEQKEKIAAKRIKRKKRMVGKNDDSQTSDSAVDEMDLFDEIEPIIA